MGERERGGGMFVWGFLRLLQQIGLNRNMQDIPTIDKSLANVRFNHGVPIFFLHD